MVSDRELLKQVAHGDDEAFRHLFDRFADRVCRYAYTVLRNRHLAEEVAQETMIAVWNGAAKYAGRSRVSTWIFGIARNQAYSLIRKEARTEQVPPPALIEPDPAPQIVQREHVMKALDRLPHDQREVVFLTFYEGLSYKEIAAIQGIPEGTVKSRMFHAKRKLVGALT